MLAGDPVISRDPEPDKNPTAALVRDGTQGTGRRGLRGQTEESGALALRVPECCLLPPLRPVKPAVGVAPLLTLFPQYCKPIVSPLKLQYETEFLLFHSVRMGQDLGLRWEVGG